MTTQIETKHIRTDGGTQARAGLNHEKVNEYKELLHESGGEWPFKDPIVVFYDGTDYWLADGFHRFHACWTNGRYVVEADVRQGTRREAQLYAAGANADHGLPRTADDKRRAVTLLLEDAEWGRWSDREIARVCKVSHPFVAKVRAETGNVTSERVYIRNGEEQVMDTAAIGGKPRPSIDDMRKRLRQSLRDEMYATYQVTGITDADLRQVLGRDWGLGGGSSGPDRTAVYKKGGSNPGFWYNNYRDSGKPTLSGKELIVWVREVLELPYPQEETAGSPAPAPSPFFVGPMAQGPEVRDALERYLDGKINRDMFITRLAKREASGHAAAMEEAVKALGAREMAIWHQAMVLEDGLPKASWDRGKTAVSAAIPTPDQIEGLVTRAANDVIDYDDPAAFAALYRRWLDDGPDDPDWHHLERRTTGIPHGLIADALRSCYRRLASEETAVSDDDYSYTAELEESIKAAETAVSQPETLTVKNPQVFAAVKKLRNVGFEVDFVEAGAWSVNGGEAVSEADLWQMVEEMETAVTRPTISNDLDEIGQVLAEKIGRVKPGSTSILDSLKSTEWLIEEMMIQAKAGSPLFFALNRAAMAVRDAMKVAKEMAAAEDAIAPAVAWLRAYVDDTGRTWRELEPNQTHHANSPCFQAFTRAFPDEAEPKWQLKQARAILERETAVVEEVSA